MTLLIQENDTFGTKSLNFLLVCYIGILFLYESVEINKQNCICIHDCTFAIYLKYLV